MKNSKVILALWLGTCAWAQTPRAVTPAVAAKPNAVRTVPPAVTPNTVRTAPPAATLPKKPTPIAKAASRPSKAASGSSVKAEGRLDAQVSGRRYVRRRDGMQRNIVRSRAVAATNAPRRASGRRDPFVSPVVERGGGTVPACTGSGKTCLIVSEIALHGVVHSPTGFIAVVMNGDHTYFLHENDPLADGAVERITKDTIILRERSSDALGRPLTREVTKKLGAPAI